jgi:hypothetical protein
MGTLPSERVGPYIRALYAALDAMAPDDSWVPMAEGLNHLHALDPAVSGALLTPGEVVEHTGMPAYGWLARAAAEAQLARRAAPSSDPSDQRLEQVRALDPELGERMRARRDLYRHLRPVSLLPTTRVQGAVRRAEPTLDLHIRYDRIAPDGRWARIRFELTADRGAVPAGVSLSDEGRLQVDDALKHVLTRHFATPLLMLAQQIRDTLGTKLTSLGRAWIGPFWWPGMTLPDDVPPALGTGLVLHASREVFGMDVRHSGHIDPWLSPPDDLVLPDGYQLFRERRLAVSQNLVGEALAWYAASGMRGTVLPIGRPRRRRL